MGLIERAVEDAVTEVHRRLEFNVAAYGTAWTGEGEDTKWIVQPLTDQLRGAVEALERVGKLAEWIERDRHERDKVFLYARELAHLVAIVGGRS